MPKIIQAKNISKSLVNSKYKKSVAIVRLKLSPLRGHQGRERPPYSNFWEVYRLPILRKRLMVIQGTDILQLNDFGDFPTKFGVCLSIPRAIGRIHGPGERHDARVNPRKKTK